MILIKSPRLKEWLKLTGRNQNWLAEQLTVKKSYMSRIMHNDCKLSIGIIDKLLCLTKIKFEELFHFDGEPDRRQFFACDEIYDGKVMVKYKIYQDEIKNKISC